MSRHSKFHLGLLAGLAYGFALYLALIYAQLGAPTEYSWWTSAMMDRKVEAAAKRPGQKLLVVAGSSALYGISAAQLDDTLGVPTVNMGTHGALGASYMLELARRTARPGDTVLLAFEYNQYVWGNGNLPGFVSVIYLDYMLARDPAYWLSLPPHSQLTLAMLIPYKRIREGLLRSMTPPNMSLLVSSPLRSYDPRRLNDHGDLTGHSRANAPTNVPKLLVPIPLSSELPPSCTGFDDIRAFCDWARTNQVRVLATFPNMNYRPEKHDSPGVQRSLKRIRDFYEGIGVPVIGTAHEVMLPRSEFFDTPYHLTEEAAHRRTLRLAEELTPYFTEFTSSNHTPGVESSSPESQPSP